MEVTKGEKFTRRSTSPVRLCKGSKTWRRLERGQPFRRRLSCLPGFRLLIVVSLDLFSFGWRTWTMDRSRLVNGSEHRRTCPRSCCSGRSGFPLSPFSLRRKRLYEAIPNYFVAGNCFRYVENNNQSASGVY